MRTIRLLLLFAALQSVACGGSDALVVYVSADERVARPLIAAFERESGIAVAPIFGGEETDPAHRLRAEGDQPRPDVFWSNDLLLAMTLAEEDLLAPLTRELPVAGPAGERDAEGRWYAFAPQARVILFAPDRVPEEERPTTWVALAKDRWKGRLAMADPRLGRTRTHLAVMKSVWDRRAMPGYYEAWLEGLAENEILIVKGGGAAVVRAVLDGSADLGMTDSDVVTAFRRGGADVDRILPRHAGDPREPGAGTLLIPHAAGLVAGSQREEAARAFLEFLLSPAAEALLREGASDPVEDPLRVDWRDAARAAEPALEAALRHVGSAVEAK